MSSSSITFVVNESNPPSRARLNAEKEKTNAKKSKQTQNKSISMSNHRAIV